jgi:hypothetical protein
MFVNRRLAGALLALLILSTGGSALAAPITGTLDLLVIDPAMNGTNLATSTEVSATDTLTFLATLDFFGAVPNGTSFGGFTLATADPAGTFTFGNAVYGSFGPTSGLIITQNANLLIVQLLGIFTPGPGLPGFDPSTATIDLTFSFSGAEGGVPDATLRLTALGVEPPSVPEPAVWSLLTIGGLSLARRRRANGR